MEAVQASADPSLLLQGEFLHEPITIQVPARNFAVAERRLRRAGVRLAVPREALEAPGPDAPVGGVLRAT